MRHVRLFVAALTLIAAPLGARADEWPSRPIHFIVAYPPGGSTDIGARAIADRLSRTLGQQVVVENKSGAGGNLGVEYAAKTAPDGYSVLIEPDQITSSPHVFKVSFDPLKDFIPVIELSKQPVVLAVNAKLGVNTLAELIALAKQKPGMGFATSGVGSQQHMVAEWFAKLAGIKLEHVPYRGGGQAINDLIAGHIPIGSLGSSPLIPHYKAGTLKLLAQSMAERSPSLPDVPTYRESGIDIALDQWLGAFVPTGTPQAIVDRLNAEMNKALKEPAIRDLFVKSAQDVVGGTPGEFAKLVHDDFEKYARLTKELNIKVD